MSRPLAVGPARVGSFTQTALLVEVPEVEELTHRWRIVHDPSATDGVPAHITALYPFVASQDLDDHAKRQVRRIASTIGPIEYQLSQVLEAPNGIWLQPEPDRAFRRLTDLIWKTFPDFPPYGGRHPNPQPHITLAVIDQPGKRAQLLERVRAGIEPNLPIRCTARSLSLFAREKSGLWKRTASFALGR